MKTIAFFDAKPYDKFWFDKLNKDYKIEYYDSRLKPQTLRLAKGADAVCVFVNDEVDKTVIEGLLEAEVKVIALRCAGYSNVDVKSAYKKINIVRVPEYSPYAVAEHAFALLLGLNRKIHKAYNRTRDFNFSLIGLSGVDLHGKTMGVIGTGKIGRVLIDICRGFGINVLAYDLYPAKNSDINYVDLNTIFKESDFISLHCPLSDDTKHLLNHDAFEMMKKNTIIINTSRGALIDSSALLDALSEEKIGGACLDVYEEEADWFFEDNSDTAAMDNVLALLVSKPNVILTSHQAFLTEEALENIANTTLKNLDEFFGNESKLTNEICYQCGIGKGTEKCEKSKNSRCF